jgi:DNA modification methylase
MGSGTTGVACVRAGKTFVDIEREARDLGVDTCST